MTAFNPQIYQVIETGELVVDIYYGLNSISTKLRSYRVQSYNKHGERPINVRNWIPHTGDYADYAEYSLHHVELISIYALKVPL